jgi:hypothetical protein
MNENNMARSILSLGLAIAVLFALLLVTAVTTMGAKPVQDADGDGFTTREGDCDDDDITVYPGAVDLCEDGIDNNCDGAVDEGCGGGGLTDSDADGLLDATEDTGFTLPSGLVLAENGETFVPPCDGAIADSLCVDPLRPDLFVIIHRASPSNLRSPPYADATEDPLAILRGFTNSSGDPVVPHELSAVTNNAPREIIDGQNAVVVNEFLDSDFGPLGFAPTGGTPNTTSGQADLYTERIKNEVADLCAEVVICNRKGCATYPVGTCRNEDGSVTGIPGLQYLYSQNVLAHEVWHVGSLAPPDSAEVILFHFDPSSGWVMEQSIGSKGTIGKNDTTATVTLYISEAFNSDSRASYRLK